MSYGVSLPMFPADLAAVTVTFDDRFGNPLTVLGFGETERLAVEDARGTAEAWTGTRQIVRCVSTPDTILRDLRRAA